MESGRAVPPELEGSIRALSERLDRMQLSQGDQLALGALEDRIAKLSEKLDASDSRLGHLEAIERGLGRPAGLSRGDAKRRPARPPRAAGRAAPAPAAPPRPAPEAPRGSARRRHRGVGAIAARSDSGAPPPMPRDARADAAAPPQHFAARATRRTDRHRARPATEPRDPPAPQMPRGPQRQPIDPNLPPDTPLEPGSGAPRIKPGSAAARIAASEAALGNARPMAQETGGKSAAIAAARNAAKAAYLDTPVKVPKSLGRKPRTWLKWPFKKAAKDVPAEPQLHAPAPPPPSSAADARADAGTDAFDDAATRCRSTTAPTRRCRAARKF